MERLPTYIWADALIKTANTQGAFATLVRKGDLERGSVLIRLLIGWHKQLLLVPEFRLDGQMAYRVHLIGQKLPSSEDITAYIDTQISYDCDIWVIDIEDATGAHFLSEPVSGIEAALEALQDIL